MRANAAGTIRLEGELEWRGVTLHVSASDEDNVPTEWHYTGPGGAYSAESSWTYDGFDYGVYRYRDNRWSFHTCRNWTEARTLARDLAAGLVLWESL